eukprot:scaffold10561_cov42-Phaeocystis_antarctica.AAC.1
MLLHRLRRLGQPRLAVGECRGRLVELRKPRLGLHLGEGALGEHKSAQPLRCEVVHVPRPLVDNGVHRPSLTLLRGDLACAHRVAGWVHTVAWWMRGVAWWRRGVAGWMRRVAGGTELVEDHIVRALEQQRARPSTLRPHED